MEGIMNLPANVGGATSQDGLDSFAPLIAAQQAARDMGYPRFTRELLSAGSEMDQAEVQEFLQTIRDAGLTSEDVALMRRVVEAVFGDPNNYPEVRDRLLREGVPEDLLPETFDLEFFVALRMAVEEAENLSQEPRPTGQDMPVQMAEGGIVGLPQMTPIAREMAAMGRNGDTMLAHITPQEAMMLKRMGGSGTINPYTGLPEFFFKKLFRGIGKAIKSVGKAVKKFAKSTVGRIVLSVALGAFLGPMAGGLLGGVGPAASFGLSAGLGVFGSSLLAGDGFKTALRSGLTAGALSFAGAGVFGEAGFSGAPAAGAPTTFAEGLKQGIANVKAPFQAASEFIRGGPEAAANVPAPGVSPVGDATTQLARSPADRFPMFEGDGTYVAKGIKDSVTVNELLPQSLPLPENLDVLNYGDIPADSFRQPLYPPANPFSSPASLTRGAPTPQVNAVSPQVNTQFARAVAETPVDQSVFTRSLAEPPGLIDRVTQGAKDLYTGAKDVVTDYLSPTRASIQPPSLQDAVAQVKADYISSGLKVPADDIVMASAKKLVTEQTPGFMAKYGPIAAVTGTTLAATGGLDSLMKVPKGTQGKTTKEMIAESERFGEDYLRANPQFAGSFVPSYYSPPTYRAAEGSGPKGVENFPRKNGAINGPGTGTSDDIPAMLSDGEFVFTARSVRNMGGGSRRKGAAKMYKLMKMLEGGPVGKTAKA
jgi:hypothetical protein